MQHLYRNKYNRNRNRRLSAILITALTGLCWAFALTQLIGSLKFAPVKSIPAFHPLQTDMAQDFMQEGAETIIPAFRPSNYTPTTATQLSTNIVFSSPEEVLSYLQSYDKDIRLISSHQENNYLDLYFYSPLLQKSSEKSSSFNLQAAVTKNHTYFGTPFINYDF